MPWGPGHTWLVGIILPMAVFTLAGLVALFSHIFHHEHADFLKGPDRLTYPLETTHGVLWGPFHFWLILLLRAGYRPRLRAELDEAERRRILHLDGLNWSNWGRNVHCQPRMVCVPQNIGRSLCNCPLRLTRGTKTPPGRGRLQSFRNGRLRRHACLLRTAARC